MAFLTVQPVAQPPVQSALQTNTLNIGVIAGVVGASSVLTAQAAAPGSKPRNSDERNKKRGQKDANGDRAASLARGCLQDITV